MCSQVETSFSQSSQQSSGTALEIIISQSFLDRGGIRRAYPKGQGGSYLAKGNFMEKGEPVHCCQPTLTSPGRWVNWMVKRSWSEH